MNRTYTTGTLLALSTLLSVGCPKEASVGEDTCIGEAIVCASDVPMTGYWTTPGGVRTADVAEIEVLPLSTEPSVRPWFAIEPAPEGTLWACSHEGSEIVLERVSLEGKTLESAQASAPPRTNSLAGNGGHAFPPHVELAVDAERRPSLWIHYPDEPGKGKDEIHLFTDSLAKPAVHLVVPSVRSEEQVYGVTRGREGSVLVRGAFRPDESDGYDFLEELLPTGEVRWRQTTLRRKLNYSGFTLMPVAALASGELTTATGEAYFMDLDPQGNVVNDGVMVDARFSSILSIVPAADGRRIVVGPTRGWSEANLGGDLAVVRFSEDSMLNDGSYDAWSITREAYGPIEFGDLAVSPDGDLYVTARYEVMRSHGGEGGEDHPFKELLCRLSHERERTACFRPSQPLGRSIVSLAANEVISNGGPGLQRVVFPAGKATP